MVTVMVVRQSTGKPVDGIRVSVGFDGLFRGMSKEEYTNNNGEAHFNNDPGDGEIFVDGMCEFKGRIEGKKVIYI